MRWQASWCSATTRLWRNGKDLGILLFPCKRFRLAHGGQPGKDQRGNDLLAGNDERLSTPARRGPGAPWELADALLPSPAVLPKVQL